MQIGLPVIGIAPILTMGIVTFSSNFYLNKNSK